MAEGPLIPGDLVSYWRRDKGAPKSQNVTAEVLESDAWMARIRRDDNGEERTIDVRRLKLYKLAPCVDPETCGRDNNEQCIACRRL